MLYPKDPASAEAAATLRRTEFTQAALFTVEYALANVWMSWGVKPVTMVGHSVGEFVCAVLAGGDAPRGCAAPRRTARQAHPTAASRYDVSVRLPAAKLEPRLADRMSIASSNSPSLCVVSGPTDDVALVKELEAEGVVVKSLHTSHAFHSPMMDPAVEPFLALVRGLPLSAPKIPFRLHR